MPNTAIFQLYHGILYMTECSSGLQQPGSMSAGYWGYTWVGAVASWFGCKLHVNSSANN